MDLKAGDCAVIRAHKGEEALSLRLQELGLLPGALLEILRFTSGRSLVEIKVRGTRLALRHEEASLIEVTY